MFEDKLFWHLALKRVPGIGVITARKLIERFGSAKQVFFTEEDSLDESLNKGVLEALRRYDPKKDDTISRELEALEKSSARAIAFGDIDYPVNLTNIPDPPMVLYTVGHLDRDELAASIVGTRTPSRYGIEQARRFAHYLAKQNVTVVSGMAMGIDANAHSAALSAGGRTIAVLGCGVDIIYPSCNTNLYHEIAERGAIISEYPLGTMADPVFFPARNRIISGLSKAVLIIEGRAKSGALITAKEAASQGRDVFALPGQVDRPEAQGPNQLIRDGATPALEPRDLLVSLKIEALEEDSRKTLKNDAIKLQGIAKKIYDVLEYEGTTADVISNKTGLEIPAILSIMTELEMKEIVKRLPGSKYAKNV